MLSIFIGVKVGKVSRKSRIILPAALPIHRKMLPVLDKECTNLPVIQSSMTGVPFAFTYGTNFPSMTALLIPHLVSGWPYLVIGIVCVIVVHHFRERLDK